MGVRVGYIYIYIYKELHYPITLLNIYNMILQGSYQSCPYLLRDLEKDLAIYPYNVLHYLITLLNIYIVDMLPHIIVVPIYREILRRSLAIYPYKELHYPIILLNLFTDSTSFPWRIIPILLLHKVDLRA